MSMPILDDMRFEGWVHAELRDEFGNLKGSCTVPNLITSVGDVAYAQRASGIGSPAAAATGMRIGTGATAVAKTGAGAAIVTKITAGNLAFDATFPTVSGTGGPAVITYKCTYGPGVGTSASAVTEAVLVNDTIATDVATAAANTLARVLLVGIGSKQATDTLTLTWTHNLNGS